MGCVWVERGLRGPKTVTYECVKTSENRGQPCKVPYMGAYEKLLWEQDAAGSNPVSPMHNSPVPSWCLSRPARGGFFIALPVQASCLNGLLTTRWRQKSQCTTLVQVADVDIGVINWVNADLVTHIAPGARIEIPPIKPFKDLLRDELFVSIRLAGTHLVVYLLDQRRSRT